MIEIFTWLHERGYRFHMSDGEYLSYHSEKGFVFYHDDLKQCVLAALEDCPDFLFIKYRWITILRKELL